MDLEQNPSSNTRTFIPSIVQSVKEYYYNRTLDQILGLLLSTLETVYSYVWYDITSDLHVLFDFLVILNLFAFNSLDTLGTSNLKLIQVVVA